MLKRVMKAGKGRDVGRTAGRVLRRLATGGVYWRRREVGANVWDCGTP